MELENDELLASVILGVSSWIPLSFLIKFGSGSLLKKNQVIVFLPCLPYI